MVIVLRDLVGQLTLHQIKKLSEINVLIWLGRWDRTHMQKELDMSARSLKCWY